VSIACFTKAIHIRRIKLTTLSAASMAVNPMPTILRMLAFDVMHGKGAMSVRLTMKPTRLSPSSTHDSKVGMTISCFGQP
jgi:hypothetical protein